MPPEAPYFVPARYVLTVLHRRGPDPVVITELARAEPVDGWTACGRPMLQSESWTAIDCRPGDTICPDCLPQGSARAAVEDVEATLW